MSEIEFWFDFGSGYAYFASLEIDAVARRHGRIVRWRPFMLGTAFKVTGATGLSRTPLKKDYALRDWQRIARLRRAPLSCLRRITHRSPSPRPGPATPSSGTIRPRSGRWSTRCSRPTTPTASTLAWPTKWSASRRGSDTIRRRSPPRSRRRKFKSQAKTISESAIERGVFGSPWMFVDGEPFWGWDRLGMLDDWLARGGW